MVGLFANGFRDFETGNEGNGVFGGPRDGRDGRGNVVAMVGSDKCVLPSRNGSIGRRRSYGCCCASRACVDRLGRKKMDRKLKPVDINTMPVPEYGERGCLFHPNVTVAQWRVVVSLYPWWFGQDYLRVGAAVGVLCRVRERRGCL